MDVKFCKTKEFVVGGSTRDVKEWCKCTFFTHVNVGVGTIPFLMQEFGHEGFKQEFRLSVEWFVRKARQRIFERRRRERSDVGFGSGLNHDEEKVFGTSDSGRDRTWKQNSPHANPEWRERNFTRSRQDEKEKGGVVHTMKRSDSWRWWGIEGMEDIVKTFADVRKRNLKRDEE